MEEITADSITTDQIRALRRTAINTGDTFLAEVCLLALSTEEDLLDSSGACTTRTECRAMCATAMNNARGSWEG